MLAMQYSIPLAADLGGDYVRERVSQRRALFDDHKGLIHKSFIYSEKDHLYAPFYVWLDVDEARKFLLDDLFKGVVDTFKRHRVRSWFVLNMVYGNRDITPTFALREVDPAPTDIYLAELHSRELKTQEKLIKDPNVYMHLVALDADRWEIMRYSLWKDRKSAVEPGTDCYQAYDVLHVSEPK